MLSRYVALCGGLGNQMFQYAYYLLLKSKFEEVRTFFPSSNWEHAGGYELNTVFGIKHSMSKWEKLYQKGFPFSRLFHILHKTYFGHNFIFKEDDLNPDKSYRYFYGTWQSEKYITNPSLVRDTFIFNESILSESTRNIAKMLGGGKVTCSVHIRRGDYQSPSFVEGFGNCCNLSYYNNAIEYIQKAVGENVMFVFFSDDIEWVRQNLNIKNAIYVNHNHGVDSWQDMYLMSICKHNIIANSTFSWWGAWLNSNMDKIVIAPKRWWSTIENDDVVPDTWIRL